MKLDSWLVARLADELDRSLRGARIQSVTALPNALLFFCYRRGEQIVLHARLDPSAPLLAAYASAAPKDPGSAGWLGDVAGLLRGCVIDGIAPIPLDRVIVADVSSRSAFGVPSPTRVVFELQPRKANALVLRQARGEDAWVIVAAQKRFAEGAHRRVAIASPYEPPPARRPTLDRPRFIVAARALSLEDVKAWERALSGLDTGCTPALAREVIYRVARSQASEPAHAALTVWAELRAQVEAALAAAGPVFAWYADDDMLACHLVPLSWPKVAPVSGASLNEWCASALTREVKSAQASTAPPVRKRLATMLARGDDEADRLTKTLADAERADELRRAGESIYSNLAQIEPGSANFRTETGEAVELDPSLTAKQNAASYFRRYKKARSGVRAMRARLETLRRNREHLEQLAWEAERTDLDAQTHEAALAEIAEAIGMRRRQRKPKRSAARDRAIELPGGALAYVGRSPKDNERLTFVLAGPNDMWFHARGVPGAHVIVKAQRGELEPQQIRAAAKLAATHSKAVGSTGVEVDFTQRKHVRRRGAGGSGQVWYTDFSTVRVDG